ncbi:MAG: TraR/DksA family transcriptional regulator [candidate division Zixibacteria bacterium]|nr:TraR/DksA family transcriptional regulator [candidate division Zixibacteria bacterium]
MKKAERNKYEKQLLAKRAQLVEELGLIRKRSLDTTSKENSGDLSSYSYHMADQGTDAMEREKAFLFASKSGRLLYHIDEALRRLRNNKDFGICSECGEPINTARLEAVPHARMCIKCKEAEEIRKSREA